MNPKESFPRPHNEKAPRQALPLTPQYCQRDAANEPSDAYTESGIDAMLEDDEIDCLEHGFMQGYNAAL